MGRPPRGRRTLRLPIGATTVTTSRTRSGCPRRLGGACLDGLELDLRLSRDGAPVIMTRRSSGSSTRRRGRGSPRPDSSGSACRRWRTSYRRSRRAFLDIELKVPFGRILLEVLAAGRGPDLANAVVSSFHDEALRRIHGMAPLWPMWLNSDDLTPATIARAERLDCSGISAEWRAIDDAGAMRVATAGLELAAWTVNRRPTYARLVELGCVAICVEGPALDG
jgi:glycerophosphoryl diester phosphodiesterase